MTADDRAALTRLGYLVAVTVAGWLIGWCAGWLAYAH